MVVKISPLFSFSITVHTDRRDPSVFYNNVSGVSFCDVCLNLNAVLFGGLLLDFLFVLALRFLPHRVPPAYVVALLCYSLCFILTSF